MNPHENGRSATGLLAAMAIAAMTFLNLSCASAPKSPVPGWKEVNGMSFTLWHPAEMQVGREPSTSFNYLYLFDPPKGTEKPPTLYVYEGFEPRTFYRDKKGLIIKRSGDVRVGAFQGLEAAGIDEQGHCWRELHLRQSDQVASVHIWYFDVTTEKSADFDTIIRTLQVRVRK